MELVELPDPEPGDGEVVVEVARAGVNFADTHATRNDYLAKQSLPLIPGGEIAGRRPTAAGSPRCSRTAATRRRWPCPRRWLIPVPDEVSDDQAAALLLQGLTAHALVHRCARLQPGETVVVEAAGGGTGTLAVQLAKRAGGAGDRARLERGEARAGRCGSGADATVDSRAEDLSAAILEANGGEQVDAVLEMSGGDAFEATPADPGAVRPHGRLRHRLARAERGHDRAPDAPLARGDRLLAHAPDPATARRSRR